MDEHRLLLPDSVRPVRGLRLYGGVPPPVEVDYVRGLREVEAKPAGPQGKYTGSVKTAIGNRMSLRHAARWKSTRKNR